MHEKRFNIKIHIFQGFVGDSFLVTICEAGFLVEGKKKYGRKSKCRI